MDRDVHPGLPGHTRISPGSDSGHPAYPALWSRVRAGCLSVTLPSCCSAIPDSQPSYIFRVGPDIFAQGDGTGIHWACSLSCGKPSQKPLTIPIRKRYDRTDSLPESDSGIRGIRTYSNMPRLLQRCHDPLLRVAAKTETVSSKRVHRQSSLPFAAALLLLIPVLFGR